MDRALPIVKGEHEFQDEKDAWEWLRNPLPPESEDALFAKLRLSLGIPTDHLHRPRLRLRLDSLEQQALGQALDPGFLREHNPVVRHTVLRRRKTLEEAGLLERIGGGGPPRPEAPRRLPRCAVRRAWPADQPPV